MFIRWPNGKLTGGKDIEKLAASYDLLPTFVDLLGLDFNPVKPLDGKSLAPLMTENNPEWPNRILYIDTQREQNLIKYQRYSVMDDNWRLVDGVDEKYAYIKVGSPYENPTRINAHDLIVGRFQPVWHQNGAIQGSPSGGIWKIEFVEDGEYSITLRRFPRESGLAINATFPAQEKRIELDQAAPAGVKNDFTEARLYVAGITKDAKIKEGQDEVTFTGKIPAGKYDMEAQLIDSQNRVHPAYYVYIEKL